MIDNKTKKDIIIKTGTEFEGCADFANMKSFSPHNTYILIDSGTSPYRHFEIINLKTLETITGFTSFSSYKWFDEKWLIFSEPQAVPNLRPWEAGDGFGISKINLSTGAKIVLKRADDTHDYFLETNQDGTVVGDATSVWIDVKTYSAEGGDERFNNPKVSSWVMDINGNLIKNLERFENYNQ